MLRETLVWHEGSGGSPVVVAQVMSTAVVKCGKGPAGGITMAPAQRSLDGTAQVGVGVGVGVDVAVAVAVAVAVGVNVAVAVGVGVNVAVAVAVAVAVGVGVNVAVAVGVGVGVGVGLGQVVPTNASPRLRSGPFIKPISVLAPVAILIVNKLPLRSEPYSWPFVGL